MGGVLERGGWEGGVGNSGGLGGKGFGGEESGREGGWWRGRDKGGMESSHISLAN